MSDSVAVIVGFLILNPANKILIVRSHKWSDKYSLPGGHIKPGETAENAVRREAMEELGIIVEPIQRILVQETIYPPDYYKRQHFISLDYLCRSQSSSVRLSAENEECAWLSPEGALKLDLTDYARKFITTYLTMS
jgi:nucleoside triphosphatase